ncbi:cold-shock protein [Kitasatospora sp. NPDC008050]|uniref:cold-shock protein n=1 Tax=Kitasatospora sp. NPDC008050 TaxID=3364021 RepID=UPI0036E052BD
MVAGRVVRFDSARGYGFIAPESGGEDVFLHVNDMLIPESYVHSGLTVEFEIEDGDRGLKASRVRLPLGPDGSPVTPPPAPLPGTRSHALAPNSLAPKPDGEDSLCDVLSTEEFLQEVTEALLTTAPSLTGEQILQIRRGLLQFGKSHGWAEG